MVSMVVTLDMKHITEIPKCLGISDSAYVRKNTFCSLNMTSAIPIPTFDCPTSFYFEMAKTLQ